MALVSIPLNFKHHILMNIVPAGLFKALTNGGNGYGNNNKASTAKESEEQRPACLPIWVDRAAAPNLEHLAFLNAVHYTLECAPPVPVSLMHLRELH